MRTVTILGTQFAAVDTSPAPDTFVTYLEMVEALPAMERVRRRTYELLASAPESGPGPQPGPGSGSKPGVDVGCGIGRAVADLADRGIAGTGVDRSATMVRAARLRYPGLRFVEGDAAALPFPTGSLSWYRAERVCLHLDDPAAALAEARRVLAPGGRIVLADPDFDSVVVACDDAAFTRRLVAGFTDGLPNGRAGTRHSADLAHAGFTDVRVEAVPLTLTSLAVAEPLWIAPALAAATDPASADPVTAERAARWQADLRDRDDRDHFLAAVTLFLTSARRPA